MKQLNKSILSFMTFVGMSLPWQVLRTLKFLIILRTSFSFALFKLKNELNSLGLILATHRSFWSVLLAANIRSYLLIISDASSAWIFGICRLETIFAKYVLKFLHNSFSFETVFPFSFRWFYHFLNFYLNKEEQQFSKKFYYCWLFRVYVTEILVFGGSGKFLTKIKLYIAVFFVCQGFRFQALIS